MTERVLNLVTYIQWEKPQVIEYDTICNGLKALSEILSIYSYITKHITHLGVFVGAEIVGYYTGLSTKRKKKLQTDTMIFIFVFSKSFLKTNQSILLRARTFTMSSIYMYLILPGNKLNIQPCKTDND